MPRSAMESIRQRLEDVRRRRNISLALTFIGRWLLAVSLLFIVLTAIGVLFGFGASAWKVTSVLWVAGIFAASFYFFWLFRGRWESSRYFVHRVEQELPDLEQRLITSLEIDERGDVPGISKQLTDKLLADAAQRIHMQPWHSFTSFDPPRRSLGLAVLILVALAGLLQLSDGFLRGTQQLTWAWSNPSAITDSALSIAIHVEPGHAALQRGDDIHIVATLDNASTAQLILYVQEDRLNWRQISMQPALGEAAGNANVFVVDLQQLSQDLVYYVEYPGTDRHDGMRSPQYQVTLFDLPRVEGMALTYNFPEYTGLDSREENPGGDILAPEGTQIQLSAELNKPVQEAYIVFDDGRRLAMSVQDRQASASFQVREDTHYRIELTDHRVRHNNNPPEYYVRAIKDRPPTISLRTPGRDQRVMPLEEVVFEVKADDDYGLNEFQLIYNMIGGEERRIDFLSDTSVTDEERPDGETVIVKTVNGQTLIYLEDLEAQPGDIISYSVAVQDNNALQGPTQVVSDIYFLEVIPTDHEFSRARSGANNGGAGGGGDSSALVTTQKEVIAATWKLRNAQKQTAQKPTSQKEVAQNQQDEQRFAADGRVIRDSQAEVAQRAQMSISRLTERGTFAEANYENAVRALQRAIEEMESALNSLDQLALGDALASEQRALQAIMQAESQINRTEVAASRSGGGSGGQNGEREELRELFEMELGELENRYQLPQQQAGQQQAGQNETLDKLKELAKRQERLTRSQRELARREDQLAEEQRRRQLEQLRREQEQLRQELAQLSQSMSQQSAQSDSQANRSGGQQGESLQQALQEMEEAAASESPSQAAAKSQKALDALRRQAASEEQNSQRSLAQLQESTKRRSEELLQQQRQLQRDVEQQSRSQSLGNTREELASSGATEGLQQQQQELRQGLDQLGRDLREIARRAETDKQREAQEAHELARALRPIQDKMETSQQIMRRGMLNLSLKLESDIESELAQVQQRIQTMGDGGDNADANGEQLAGHIRELRNSLETLQQQLGQTQLPNELAQRRGESSDGQQSNGAEGNEGNEGPPASRSEMQQSLQRSRELAQDLTQLGSGGQPWSGSARSIRSQLTQKNLEEFLNQPELLAALLQPLVELERQLRVESELSGIDRKLFSASEQDVPEQYKALVESYYRLLSERKRAGRTEQ